MQEIPLPALELRLQRRYHKLVVSHMRAASPLVAGLASLPDEGRSFAATQGAWRFNNNEHVTLSALVEPLRVCGQQRLATTQTPFALLVHDWSKLALADNPDAGPLTHAADVGYELTPCAPGQPRGPGTPDDERQSELGTVQAPVARDRS